MSQKIVRLPDGRLVTVGTEFSHAANNRYTQAGPRFAHGSKGLWDEVVNNTGKVDFYTARFFLESHANNLFGKNPAIADPRANGDLKALGFETVMALYEAVTERPMQDNSLYLDLLNSSIDLSKAELTSWTLPVKAFYAESNRPFLEKKWEEAKRDGRISPREGSFSQMMAESFDNPQLVSRGGYLRRKAHLQFISDAYSDFVGEDRVQIELIEAQPSLGGFHTVDERTGRHIIGININNFAFQLNFQSIMNVLNHERYHASDRMLGDRYRRGDIDQSSPHYKRARIAAAAMGENGYISGNTEAGPLAYREQIIEVGAHHAGKIAEYWAHQTYAREPDPVLRLRGDKTAINLAKDYEMAAQQRPQVRYPDGMSPFGRRAALEVPAP